MGARHVDVGQDDETWVVPADPEGNESTRRERACLLADAPRNCSFLRTLTGAIRDQTRSR